MTVKVIVTDMDGTFLNDAKQYDRPRFLAQFAQLQQQGIEFVVASGNQYYQLISFFPGNSRADLFCRRERCAGVRTRPTAVPRRADPP